MTFGRDIGIAAAYGMGLALLIAAAIGGGLVAIVAWGIPWLWQIVKPWLHTITS